MSHGATWYAKRCRQTSRATVRPMAHKGMKFGIFLAPFHRLGENPTLAMNRDMELIEWLDWVGSHEGGVGGGPPGRRGGGAPPRDFLRPPARGPQPHQLGPGGAGPAESPPVP